MKLTFEQMLHDRIPVIFDGAMGTEIQKIHLAPDDFGGKPGCNEILNVRQPEIIRGIHESYLKAGAHVLETNTFGGSRIKLAEYGLAEKVREINIAGARVAREAVDGCGRENAFVCGTMGPTGFLPSSTDPEMGKLGYNDLESVFAEQAEALLAGGVDILLLETMQDLLEVRAAMHGIRNAMKAAGRIVPLQVQVTMDASGRMLLGSDVAAFLGAVANLKPAVIGFNCGTGPDEIMAPALTLAAESPYPVSVIPNAGIPENTNGVARYSMGPDRFASLVRNLVTDHGVAVVGGCCGTTPGHIAAVKRELEGKLVALRKRPVKTLFLSTGISGLAVHRSKQPVIIGERINTQGSAAAKKLVLARNWDELVHLGIEQQERGAAILDVSMAINERDDEVSCAVSMMRVLRDRVRTPLCLDSTDPAVFEESLLHSPGSVLINSVNLEKNGDKARRICQVAAQFGCPVIALPIDDKGMARDVERKLELAAKLRDIITGEMGIPEHFIFFDPLVFTLATGDEDSANAAVDSLEAMKLLKKQWPDMRTVMGVSNVSFGLNPRARRIINNLLLHHAATAGLDAAIFNPMHLDNIETYNPDERRMCEDLLFNRDRESLTRVAQHFENIAGPKEVKEEKVDAPLLTAEEQLQNKIFKRNRTGLNDLILTMLKKKPALEILNTILLPAMAEVGERMARGEMILPFVLQAAEVMKEAVGILEPYFDKDAAVSKGTMVMATVNGDIHDIGKNLVCSILKNQGYKVVDLGKSVPSEEIFAAIEREKPDAIGLSALLVTTSREMGAMAKKLHEAKMSVPLIIGGAAVNRQFASRIELVENETRYIGGVFYGKDAFDASRILERVTKGEPPLKLNAVSAPPVAPAPPAAGADGASMPASEPVEHEVIINPMFYGTGEMLIWDSAKLLEEVDRRELYKGYWRTGTLSNEAFERESLVEFDPAFEALKQEILAKSLVDARGYYGIWPVYAKDETIVFLNPSDFKTEEAVFTFPRQKRKAGRSIADWIRPEGDCVALQVVTIGGGIAQRSREYFQKEDKYSRGFYLNGIGSYLTEIIADKVTAEARKALFITDKKQGRRYGFGYPGLPGLEHQKDLLDLLCAADRLGITLTEGFQMIPEHSTVTMFVHHKGADYM